MLSWEKTSSLLVLCYSTVTVFLGLCTCVTVCAYHNKMAVTKQPRSGDSAPRILPMLIPPPAKLSVILCVLFGNPLGAVFSRIEIFSGTAKFSSLHAGTSRVPPRVLAVWAKTLRGQKTFPWIRSLVNNRPLSRTERALRKKILEYYDFKIPFREIIIYFSSRHLCSLLH